MEKGNQQAQPTRYQKDDKWQGPRGFLFQGVSQTQELFLMSPSASRTAPHTWRESTRQHSREVTKGSCSLSKNGTHGCLETGLT